MKKTLFTAISIAVFFFHAPFAHAGFGITPPYVRSDALTRGSVYTQEIIIVRSDPIEDLSTEVTINVPGVNAWFSVDKGKTFILPKGAMQFPIKITVTVPEDAKYGAYTGNIRIRTASLQSATNGVSIALGAQIDVDIKVADKIYNFEVRRVELSESETGYKMWWLDFPGKIPFFMHIENTGNAPYSPSKVRFDVWNNAKSKLLESTENTNALEKVEAFKMKKIAAYLPTWLPPGGYLVEYKIYKEETPVKTGQLTLTVLPKGTLPGYVGYGFEGLKLEDQLSVVGPIGAPIVIFGTYRLLGGKSRKSRRKGGTRPPSAQEPPASSPRPEIRRGPAGSHVVDLSRKR